MSFLYVGMKGVVSVFPSKTLQPNTMRLWDFLRFPQSMKRNLLLERDVIVGVIGTRILLESASFSNKGFGPSSRRWKGACENFKCNKYVSPQLLFITSVIACIKHAFKTSCVVLAKSLEHATSTAITT